MLLAPALRRAAARDRRAARARGSTSASAPTLERVEVAGPGFLNLFLADAWYAAAAARACSPRRATGPAGGAGRARRASTGRVRLRQPDRPADRGRRPPRRLRRRARRVARVRRPHRSSASTTSTTPAARCERFGASIARPHARGEPSRPRTATRATTSPSSPSGSAAQAPSPDDVGRARPPRRRADASSRSEETLAALRRRVRHAGPRSARCTRSGRGRDGARASSRERGHVYESEGATWLRTTELGDDKDRVLIRSDGEPTYFAADIAYHRDKLERGFERLIDVLGADHHGYVARLRAALAALGADPGRLEVPIMQLVHVVEGGERAQMSKRKGEFVTLDELIDDIGVDAARFFMLAAQPRHDRSTSTSSWPRQTSTRTPSTTSSTPTRGSPASCARRARVPRRGRAGGGPARRRRPGRAGRARADQAAARAARTRSARRPSAARRTGSAPTRTAAAADFHAFYRDCQVVGAEGEGSRTRGWRPACSRSARSRARWGCSGSARPRACSRGS